MAHLRLRRLPVAALPAGATSSTDGAEVLVEGPDRAALALWQLGALLAGELVPADLLGGGEGPAERAPVTVSADEAAVLVELRALPANASLTQLRAVQTRAKSTSTTRS